MRIRTVVAALYATAILPLLAASPATQGAKVGQWTMDFDAAKTLAKEKNLPILINFTGSDWCGWCKLMDRSVCSKPEWEAYAKENLVLVYIDFPQDKALVPVHFVARNQKLSDSFDVRGYPTYIVLASDGETRLGQLGASRTATPESFMADLKKLTDADRKAQQDLQAK